MMLFWISLLAMGALTGLLLYAMVSTEIALQCRNKAMKEYLEAYSENLKVRREILAARKKLQKLN